MKMRFPRRCGRVFEGREKLIGKTVEVQSDVSDALDAFSKALRPGDASDLVGRCKELIRNVYTASGYENLRNLRAALLGFDDLWHRSIRGIETVTNRLGSAQTVPGAYVRNAQRHLDC